MRKTSVEIGDIVATQHGAMTVQWLDGSSGEVMAGCSMMGDPRKRVCASYRVSDILANQIEVPEGDVKNVAQVVFDQIFGRVKVAPSGALDRNSSQCGWSDIFGTPVRDGDLVVSLADGSVYGNFEAAKAAGPFVRVPDRGHRLVTGYFVGSCQRKFDKNTADFVASLLGAAGIKMEPDGGGDRVLAWRRGDDEFDVKSHRLQIAEANKSPNAKVHRNKSVIVTDRISEVPAANPGEDVVASDMLGNQMSLDGLFLDVGRSKVGVVRDAVASQTEAKWKTVRVRTLFGCIAIPHKGRFVRIQGEGSKGFREQVCSTLSGLGFDVQVDGDAIWRSADCKFQFDKRAAESQAGEAGCRAD